MKFRVKRRVRLKPFREMSRAGQRYYLNAQMRLNLRSALLSASARRGAA